MKLLFCAALLMLCACKMNAHRIGNFSVNHYTKIQVSSGGAELAYVLDFAEIPTAELFEAWGGAPESAEELHLKAAHQALEWAQA